MTNDEFKLLYHAIKNDFCESIVMKHFVQFINESHKASALLPDEINEVLGRYVAKTHDVTLGIKGVAEYRREYFYIELTSGMTIGQVADFCLELEQCGMIRTIEFYNPNIVISLRKED